MATKYSKPESITGFDVVCTIGRVTFDATGDRSPLECAFLLIAQHGTEGRFSFPSEDGGPCVVEVTYPERDTP